MAQAQAQAQEILAALADSTSSNELKSLSGAMINAISTDPRLVEYLGSTIGKNNVASDSIIRGISRNMVTKISNAVANANLQPGGLIHTAITTAVAAPGLAPAAAVADSTFSPSSQHYTNPFDAAHQFF